MNTLTCRQLALIKLLLDSPEPLSRQQIFEALPQFYGTALAQNELALNRRFTRDLKELSEKPGYNLIIRRGHLKNKDKDKDTDRSNFAFYKLEPLPTNHHQLNLLADLLKLLPQIELEGLAERVKTLLTTTTTTPTVASIGGSSNDKLGITPTQPQYPNESYLKLVVQALALALDQ